MNGDTSKGSKIKYKFSRIHEITKLILNSSYLFRLFKLLYGNTVKKLNWHKCTHVLLASHILKKIQWATLILSYHSKYFRSLAVLVLFLVKLLTKSYVIYYSIYAVPNSKIILCLRFFFSYLKILPHFYLKPIHILKYVTKTGKTVEY